MQVAAVVHKVISFKGCDPAESEGLRRQRKSEKKVLPQPKKIRKLLLPYETGDRQSILRGLRGRGLLQGFCVKAVCSTDGSVLFQGGGSCNG